MQTTYKNTEKLTAKQIAVLMNVSTCTASRYMQDIKLQYGIKIVLYVHFLTYFCIMS